jgi:hypothetical protein
MKTEWEFHFETHNFIFEKEHKYKAKVPSKNSSEGMPMNLKEMSFDVRITPDNDCKDQNAEQTGSLFITLPLTYEMAKEEVHSLVHLIAERISFESGEFNIHGSPVICKRISETPKEEEEIGDSPYAIEMHMEEVVSPPTFDSKSFTERSKTSIDLGLVSQHNAAKKALNPIDKFLGFFKILESQFMSKECLEDSETLFKIYAGTFKFGSIDQARTSFIEFIKGIIHARPRCAHLKANKNFGYVPIDPRVRKEVEPFLLPLEVLTYATITSKEDSV